jgi:hypothetical protein
MHTSIMFADWNESHFSHHDRRTHDLLMSCVKFVYQRLQTIFKMYSNNEIIAV